MLSPEPARRRVLIVSPHFPPTNAPDLQRVRASLPFYRDFGWDAEVLAVDAADVPVPTEPRLAATLPSHVPVHRTRALSRRWTKWVGLGTLGLRAWPGLRREGARLLATGRFDCVFFSTTQFAVLTLGPKWRRECGVPFVIDVQDPWLTDYYERPGAPPPPGGWKYRFAQWQARRWEGPCFEAAAGIISVNDPYLQQLRARYPRLARTPMATVPFGVNPADLDVARSGEVVPAFTRQPNRLHVAYVGAAGLIMRDALTALLAALKNLRALSPAAADRLRLHFIGTSYAPAGQAQESVLPLARAAGVADLVEEQPVRIGYFNALRTLLEADAVLLLGSGETAYTPSKLATLALVAKPILAVVPAAAALGRTFERMDRVTIARYGEPAAHQVISDWLAGLAAAGQPARASGAPELPAEYDARRLTEQQCAVFAAALAAPPS